MNTGTSAGLWAGKGGRKAISLIHVAKYHIATDSRKVNTFEPSQRFTTCHWLVSVVVKAAYKIISQHNGIFVATYLTFSGRGENSGCLNTHMFTGILIE